MSNPTFIKEDYLTINGKKVFYRYRNGTSNAFICFLHGYPTSSLDYVGVFEKIPSEFHVLAHDFLGFGQSDKPLDNNYLLSDQADLTLGLYESFGIEHMHLIAHDYGTSVATELIARNNNNELDFNLRSVTLCNGSMLIDMSKLRLIQKLLKSKWVGNLVAYLSSESTFQRNMKNIWFDKSRYKESEMKIHWDLLISKKGKKVLPRITRYIDQRYLNYERWVGGLSKSKLPYHILWAANDPVAVVEMAYRLDEIISDSHLTIIKNCGHYPMIEQEEVWINHVLKFVYDKESI